MNDSLSADAELGYPREPSASAHARPITQSNAVTAQAGADFRIPSLDGIRALSFMLVFLAHAGLNKLMPGGLGVTVFFFLSGYLITTLLRRERERCGSNSLRDFYIRRAFRILPPFYTVLALAVAMTTLGLLPEPLRAGSLLSQLAHASNYWILFRDAHGFPAGTVVYWSLAVEEHFYLVFPALFILLQRSLPRRQGAQAGIVLGACACVLAWRLALVLLWDAPEVRTSIATDTRIDSILFGCALALYGNPMLDAPRGSAMLWRGVLLPAGVTLLLLTMMYRAPWFRETLRYSLQGLALIPMFVVAIRFPEWGIMRHLNHPWIARLGVLSYSLYLCHQVFIVVFETRLLPGSRIVTGSLAFAASLLCAAAVERWIERPSARARRALTVSG